MSADATALGWAPQDAPAEPSVDAQVTWLIDNADSYRAIVRCIRAAQDAIWISQLALDADCVAYDVEPSIEAPGTTTTILRELLDATERGVEVRVLLNASLLLDTAKPLRAHLAAIGADRRMLRVRGVSAFPQLLHAKMVLVDDETAILVGSPFANGYWDDARHAPTDDRRPTRELGGRPVHDVSTLLAGPVVRSLRTTFARMWNGATDVAADDTDPLRVGDAPSHRPTDDAPLRVVRTAPRKGPTEILPALLDGIASAERAIYIEHQYLSARPVVAALVRALARNRSLEVIMLLNQNPDVTAYRAWQNARFRESGLLGHPRVGVFTLWTSALDGARRRRRVNQVFVHSKVVTIDDQWALVGSANLDGVSLHSYGDDFSGVLGRRIFRGVRNFDVGLVVDGRANASAAAQVCALRATLWGEHLGSTAAGDDDSASEGLTIWRAIARRNAAELGNPYGASDLDGPFVLPYSTASTPPGQLNDVGVLFAPDALELCFEPSWLEVHLSPNWVRNMFG